MMEVALPLATGMDCYEDMFKEITRKLYGDEAGLPDGMQPGDAGADNPMRCPPQPPADYDASDAGGEAHGNNALTAFGLAALMQNGFPPHPGMLQRMDHVAQDAKYRAAAAAAAAGTLAGAASAADDKWVASDEALQWTGSRVASYNPAQKLFRCADCECVGFLSRVAEHWLGTHANLRVFQCPQCPYSSAWARCVRMHLTRQHNVSEPPGGDAALYKENPVLDEVTKFLQRLKARVERDAAAPAPAKAPSASKFAARPAAAVDNASKRYCCGFCPYATDRRDLFTRHENIHREEKPFQCYVCQKQFNRADHVKKHFLRMHRDYPYDLNRIRRQPPKNASGMSYYHKYNSAPPSGNGTSGNQRPPEGHAHDGMMPQGAVPHHLNIPGGFSAGLGGARMPGSLQPQKSSKAVHNGCNAKSHGSKTKKKGDKRYSCCYCAWSGVDNWCLKRHLNTHLKPFVCGLCDYKAARSERLATHVLKVHNKKACSRCSYMADDQAQLTIHLQEHHPLDHRNMRPANSSARNAGSNAHAPPPMASSFGGHHNSTPFGQQGGVKREHYDYDMFHQHHRPMVPALKSKPAYGAAERLFHYMEVSDTSDQDDSGQDMADQDEEPPPFVCHRCGCEFVDDTSLEVHNLTHHLQGPVETEAAGAESSPAAYQCTVCAANSATQANMMEHMRSHTALTYFCRAGDCGFTARDLATLHEHMVAGHRGGGGSGKCVHCGAATSGSVACGACEGSFRKAQESATKGGADTGSLSAMAAGNSDDQSSMDGAGKRSRKQRQPRKLAPESSDSEIQVHRHSGFAKRRCRRGVPRSEGFSRLRDKYTAAILSRKGRKCNWCRQEMKTFPYHTAVSLALHRLWKHTGTKFRCEHCDRRCRHQYQVILHASREHVNLNHPYSRAGDSIKTVPESLKEPLNLLNTSVPGKLQPPFFNTNGDNVPEKQMHGSSKQNLPNNLLGHNMRLDAYMPSALAMSATQFQQIPLLPSSAPMS